MKALLVVDVQNDFCPGGALPAPEGDKVVPVINKLMDKFPLVLASKDWHPEDTIHFKRWPVHCVRGTKGAELHPDLKKEKISFILLKGTGNKDDGYSAFEATNVDLKEYFNQHKIKEVYIAGLTLEYCVKLTAIDAIKSGFKAIVIQDAIKGINEKPGDVEQAVYEMKIAGVIFINSNDITTGLKQ